MREPILVVDGDEAACESACRELVSGGFEVRSASDAVEAASVLEHFRPRLILIDVRLRGMSGLELARRLKAKPSTRGATILAMVPPGQSSEDATREAGCAGAIDKPRDPAVLLAQIAPYLGG